MPRVSEINLVQINRQFDTLDNVNQRLANVEKQLQNVGFQTTISDPTHAPQTTNNLNFTWTGSTGVVSWAAGAIRDKNASAQSPGTPAAVSAAPGTLHVWTVPPGTVNCLPSTYYWMVWNPQKQTMLATTDVSAGFQNHNNLVLCQIYTGTSGQTGSAGGGGSNGGVDLSGARYKAF
jgi:hypothetical protein